MRRLYLPGTLSALTVLLTTCSPTPPGNRLDIKNQPELVPHKTQADAEQFRRDHGANTIVRFEEVTASLLATL